MSFGDHAGDAALRLAWQRFCRQLEEAGDEAFKDFNPANSLQRADAFRYLTQNLGQAFDSRARNEGHQISRSSTRSARPSASSAATTLISPISRHGSTANPTTGSRATAAPRASSISPCRAHARQQPDQPELAPSARAVRRHARSQSVRPRHGDRAGTAASSSTSAAHRASPTGCRRRPAHANCSSAKVSTTGPNARDDANRADRHGRTAADADTRRNDRSDGLGRRFRHRG